jgi:hypothetical protein
VIAPNTYEYHNIAPRKDINDHHEQFILAKNTKQSATNAVAGMGYPFPSFVDFMVASQVDSVSWYGLADQMEMYDVEVNVDLVVWNDHLQHNPMPDPEALFLFDAMGYCPDLPGYEAMNATTGMPFVGEMNVVSQTTLAIIYKPGDADLDGDVDLDDFMALKSNFGVGFLWQHGDFDRDLDVDLDDFIILKNSFGTGAVPEPSTLSLLMVASLAAIRRRR